MVAFGLEEGPLTAGTVGGRALLLTSCDMYKIGLRAGLSIRITPLTPSPAFYSLLAIFSVEWDRSLLMISPPYVLEGPPLHPAI